MRDGKAVPLTPKVFDILLVLVQNNGHVLGKDELMKAVWPDSFVEEGNLTRNVSTLRTALGGGPDEQQYIETVPRIGYRFVAGVEKVDEVCDLDEEKHSSQRAVIEDEGSSDQDQAEQAFNENGSMVASGFRVLPRELISPADDAAENQTLPVPADAGSPDAAAGAGGGAAG
ncbi:MAG: transcriptional regulator, partial [bacterium]